MLPVPNHLKKVIKPAEQACDEMSLRADLHCGCGSHSFQLLYPDQTSVIEKRLMPSTACVGANYFYIVRRLCTSCGEEVTLLDADFHGWNGVICHDSVQASVPRPQLIPWQCVDCADSEHEAEIFIQGESREEFIAESGDGDNDRWPDAFGYFALSVTCSKCRLCTPDLFAYETM